MKQAVFAIASMILLCGFALAQGMPPPEAGAFFTAQLPPPGPDGTPPPPNVFVHTQVGPGKANTAYFAFADASKPVTGAPYAATATTETTQVLADGNRIENKTESSLARDSQGRTRRQETMSNIGPLAMSAPKMAFISDPVARVNYILDLNAQTARMIKLPDGAGGPIAVASASGTAVGPVAVTTGTGGGVAAAGGSPMIATTIVQKKALAAGGEPGVEQRIWINGANDPSQAKTENLGTQVIEGVSADGVRTTHTIPAGQIGNERPLDIVSEVWTSPELQMVVYSKRTDPRFGETVYKLTDIRRGDPDPSLFQVPSNFSIKTPGQPGN